MLTSIFICIVTIQLSIYGVQRNASIFYDDRNIVECFSSLCWNNSGCCLRICYERQPPCFCSAGLDRICGWGHGGGVHLEPAMEQAVDMGQWAFLPAAVGFWLGILFLLVLDRAIPHLHQHSDEPEGPHIQLKRTTMLALDVALG